MVRRAGRPLPAPSPMPLRPALLAALALAAGAASAQISTDRPGFGFSPATVGAGVFQVEAGTPQGTLNSGADAYSVPVALRYGLTPTVEVRVSASVLDAVGGGGADLDADVGFRSVTAGAKVSVPAGDVDLAVIPEAVIPTEGGGDVVFQVNVPAGFALGDLGLTLVPGLVTGGGVDAAQRGRRPQPLARGHALGLRRGRRVPVPGRRRHAGLRGRRPHGAPQRRRPGRRLVRRRPHRRRAGPRRRRRRVVPDRLSGRPPAGAGWGEGRRPRRQRSGTARGGVAWRCVFGT